MNNTKILEPNGSIQSNNSIQLDNISDEFKGLFEISPELKKAMKGLSLGLILINCTLRTLELTNDGKKLSLVFKHCSEKNMEIVIKFKIDGYNQIVKNIALPTLEAVFSLISIGGGSLKIANKTVSVLVRGASGQLDSKHQSQMAGWDHSYKTEDQLVEESRRRIQEANTTLDKLRDIMSKTEEQLHESFKSVATAA